MKVKVKLPGRIIDEGQGVDFFGDFQSSDWLVKKVHRQDDIFEGTKHPVHLKSGAECTVLSVDSHEFEYESPDEEEEDSSSSSMCPAHLFESSDGDSDSWYEEPFWRWR